MKKESTANEKMSFSFCLYMYTSEGWRCHDKKYCVSGIPDMPLGNCVRRMQCKNRERMYLKQSLRKEHPCGDRGMRIAPP